MRTTEFFYISHLKENDNSNSSAFKDVCLFIAYFNIEPICSNEKVLKDFNDP